MAGDGCTKNRAVEGKEVMWDDVTKEELDDDDCIWDLTAELHHELFGGSEYHFRVLEKVKVEYLPVEIQLNDVTGEF